MNEAVPGLPISIPRSHSAQAPAEDRGSGPAPARDTVLQRAVDLITAINFYQSKK